MPLRARTPLRTCRLGRVEYGPTARLQRSLRAAREAGAIDDVLLLLEHDPVITCGTRTEPNEVAYARTTDVPLVPVERGGKATYHGPGQLVAYPIVDLSVVAGDVKVLVHRLEEAIIRTLAEHDLDATRRAGLPGVWVAHATRPRKVASVGLRLTRGVTFHGIAINVENDLTPFGWFTPCGIPDAQMTSLARELDVSADAADGSLTASVEQSFLANVVELFGFDPAEVQPGDLELVAARHPVEQPALALPGEPRARRATRIDLAGASA